MATVLAQVLDRLDVLLKANVPVGCNVFRERTEAESRSEAPCVNVTPREIAIESFSREMDKHQVSIELRIHVRVDPPTPAAEVIHASFHGALIDDSTLQALVESIRIEAASLSEVEADATALDKNSRYRFTYLIPKNTL
jgi:hypothetical protein